MSAELNFLIKTMGYPQAENILKNSKSIPYEMVSSAISNNENFQRERQKLKQGWMEIQSKKLKSFLISSLFLTPNNQKNSYVISECGK